MNRLAVLAFLIPFKALALDAFEIQVYEADVNEPMKAGIELHTNMVLRGRTTPSYEGELPPNSLSHFTLEPSFGITKFWELGGYIQMAVGGPSLQAYYGGFKLRSKFVVPREQSGHALLGLNVEVGRVPTQFEEDGWASELRPIIGYELGRWLFDLNPIVGWALSGANGFWPDFEPALKIRYNTGHGFGLGVEYYAGLGNLGKLGPISTQEHILYLAGELIEGPIELNVGLGRGLTAASNDWTLKAIFGKSF